MRRNNAHRQRELRRRDWRRRLFCQKDGFGRTEGKWNVLCSAQLSVKLDRDLLGSSARGMTGTKPAVFPRPPGEPRQHVLASRGRSKPPDLVTRRTSAWCSGDCRQGFDKAVIHRRGRLLRRVRRHVLLIGIRSAVRNVFGRGWWVRESGYTGSAGRYARLEPLPCSTRMPLAAGVFPRTGPAWSATRSATGGKRWPCAGELVPSCSRPRQRTDLPAVAVRRSPSPLEAPRFQAHGLFNGRAT